MAPYSKAANKVRNGKSPKVLDPMRHLVINLSIKLYFCFVLSLNSESNEEESIPLYSEITSQIVWLQFVTGSRDHFAMQELEERSTRSRGNDGIEYRNRLNEGFDGTGPGIRVRYAQLRNCIDISPFIS